MTDHETISDTGDGGAASIIAGLLLVAIVVVGVVWYLGLQRPDSQSVVIDLPRVTVDVAGK